MKLGLGPRQLERARRDLEQALIPHFSRLTITLMNLAVLDIDQKVYKLYGLTEEESQITEPSPVSKS